MQFIVDGLIGAILGAVLSMVIFFYSGGINWGLAFVLMGICFFLGAVLGGRFLSWISNVIDRVW